jgi:hypothetical protein
MASNTARSRFKSVLQKETLESEDTGAFLSGLTRLQKETLSLCGISCLVNLLKITGPREIIQFLDAVEKKAGA